MSARQVLLSSLVLLLLPWAVLGCAGDEPPESGVPGRTGPVAIRVTEDMAGASTALKVGHVLRIELPARPLRGFAWEIESVDASVLRVPVFESCTYIISGLFSATR